MIMDKDDIVIADAQHLEEAKHLLDTIEEAFYVYDTKRGYIRLWKFIGELT